MAQLKMDRRPTLASWPKRIYDWPELPRQFLLPLEEWRNWGLPPGNVTYIPKVNQYGAGVEYATAWLNGEAVLLTGRERGVEQTSLCTGTEKVIYTVQLLKCGVEAEGRDGRRVKFSYNKTKEDQLLPVLNLLLGNAPDCQTRRSHPATQALERLRADSYAMYNTSALCYRFGDEIFDSLWLRGKARGFGRRRQKPEYFLARMERGMVGIYTDFYGTSAVYLPWVCLPCAEMKEETSQTSGFRRGAELILAEKGDVAFRAPLLPEQREAAECFVRGIRETGVSGRKRN